MKLSEETKKAIIDLYNNGLKNKVIAEKLGLKLNKVCYEIYKGKSKFFDLKYKHVTILELNQIEELYLKHEMKISEISKRLNVPRKRITHVINCYGFFHKRKDREFINVDEIIAYWRDGLSVAEIASMMDKKRTSIRYQLQKLHLI